MQVIETTYTVNQHGSLKIPKATLQEMGLVSGNHVRVAYITEDGTQNTYREFLLSAEPLDTVDVAGRIAIPMELMEQAGIPPNAEIQVLCLKDAIVLCKDAALTINELQGVLESLGAAVEIAEQLPDCPDTALTTLKDFMDTYMEGVEINDEERDNN